MNKHLGRVGETLEGRKDGTSSELYSESCKRGGRGEENKEEEAEKKSQSIKKWPNWAGSGQSAQKVFGEMLPKEIFIYITQSKSQENTIPDGQRQ